MPNPMLSMLNQNRVSSQIQPIKNALNMVKTAQNPQLMLNQLMQNNPMYSQVQQIIQQNGGDAQKAFYSLAQQMGVDPNQILNQLK